MRDLLEAAQNGDAEAFAELFQQHAQMLWRTAVSTLGNEEEAADALQETAVRAWVSIPRFDRKCKLSTWLTRILLNACFDELRSRRKLVPYAEVLRATDGSEHKPFMHGNVDDDAAGRCTRIDIESAMNRLSKGDRLVLTLFYVNDMPTAEIASLLGISDGATRTRLTRARERLKRIYSEQETDDISLDREGITEETV